MKTVHDDKEIWESAIKGDVFLKTYDNSGSVKDTRIAPGKKFEISTRERLLNQEIAASETLDMFQNGTLRPVVIESAVDYEEIKSNPNLISEGDMADIFALRGKAFDVRIAEISNTYALQRMLELVEEEAVNASMAQVRKVEARVHELSPRIAGTEAPESDEEISFKEMTL